MALKIAVYSRLHFFPNSICVTETDNDFRISRRKDKANMKNSQIPLACSQNESTPHLDNFLQSLSNFYRNDLKYSPVIPPSHPSQSNGTLFAALELVPVVLGLLFCSSGAMMN